MKRLIAVMLIMMLLMPFGCSCYRLEINLGKPTEAPVAPQATQQTQTEANTAETTPASTDAPQNGTVLPVDAATEQPEPTEVPAATALPETPKPYTPDLSLLPIDYDVYEEVGWEVNEATMFEYDIDFDGKEETVSFKYDEDAYITTITIDSKSIILPGSNLTHVILIDLDPATPYVNLLVCIDGASDDYITTELHYVNGSIVKGVEVMNNCRWDAEEEKLMFYESSDMLGTKTGKRSYSGENLKPDTEWLEIAYEITEEELKNNRSELIEFGDLLHLTRDLPCEVNGKPAKIAKGSYIYMLRFNDAHDTAEVRTENGIEATLRFTYKDWTYYIDGKKVESYFDNLMFAD